MKLLARLSRLRFPLMLHLSAMPAALFLLFPYVADQVSALLGLCAVCVLLACACVLLPGRMRPAACALSTALLLLLSARLLPLRGRPMLLLTALLLASLIPLSLPLGRWRAAQVSPFFYVAGVIAQFVVHALLRLQPKGDPIHTALDAPLSLMCILYLFLLLLAFSRISLNSATLSRHRLPAVVGRVNTLLTVAFMALSLLLAALPAVSAALARLWRALKTGAAQLIWLLSRLFPVDDMSGGMGSGAPMLPGEGGLPIGEPSKLAVLLEHLASLLALGVLVAGCTILLRRLAVLLVRLVRHVLARLSQMAAAATEDYVDEITDTREDSEASRVLPLPRRRARMVYPDTPAGQIRRRYAQLLRRNSAWASSSTARENLPTSAAAIYERARYSGHAPAVEDAQRFEQETR